LIVSKNAITVLTDTGCCQVSQTKSNNHSKNTQTILFTNFVDTQLHS